MAYRKSKKIGAFRVTTTGKGVSVSAGVPGYRVSVNNKGDVRRTVSAPGTGWYKTEKIGSLRHTEAPTANVGTVKQDNEQRFQTGPNTVVVSSQGFRMIDANGKSGDFWPRSSFAGAERDGTKVRLFLRVSDDGLAAVDCELRSDEEAQRLEAAWGGTNNLNEHPETPDAPQHDEHQPGDIVNGCFLGEDGEWHLTDETIARNKKAVRKMAIWGAIIVAIIVGLIVVISGGGNSDLGPTGHTQEQAKRLAEGYVTDCLVASPTGTMARIAAEVEQRGTGAPTPTILQIQRCALNRTTFPEVEQAIVEYWHP